MYDAVFVIIDAFNKLLRKKPDQFRSSYTSKRGNQPSYTNSTSGFNGSANMNGIVNNFNTASGSTNSNNRLLDCNIPKGHHPNPWEHGDKISRYLRKVSMNRQFLYIFFFMFVNFYFWVMVGKINNKIFLPHSIHIVYHKLSC